jgi:3-deoxy-manno-octulosonate cytidylyltransferase (CMP-KDO synthetase)
MTTAILIPARLNSTRFPNKMLADLNGVPLIHHVYRKCAATGLDTYVLTDSDRIASVLPIPSESIIMTSADHENGTSRCMEAIGNPLEYDWYVNVQGDMPDITEDIIFSVRDALKYSDVSTAYTKMSDEDRADPNVVKMIHSRERAHWFLRAPLTYGDRHLGVYGYTRMSKSIYSVMKKYLEEDIEKLEQLRWLQNGIKIGTVEVDFDGVEINTPEDLERWKRLNSL